MQAKLGAVIVGHGGVAKALVAAARELGAQLPPLRVVSLGAGQEGAAEEIAKAVRDLGKGVEDVVVLTDMFGGPATSLALQHFSERVEVVTGVNLPILVALGGLGECDLAEAARALGRAGRDSIHVASELLESPKRS